MYIQSCVLLVACITTECVGLLLCNMGFFYPYFWAIVSNSQNMYVYIYTSSLGQHVVFLLQAASAIALYHSEHICDQVA